MEDNTIYFHKICINTTTTTNIHFKNNNFVKAELVAKIDNSNFNVSSDYLEILPYEEGVLTISFSPKIINVINNTIINRQRK